MATSEVPEPGRALAGLTSGRNAGHGPRLGLAGGTLPDVCPRGTALARPRAPCDDCCIVNHLQNHPRMAETPTEIHVTTQLPEASDPAAEPARASEADASARDAAIRRVLRHSQTIDITTTGRRSGQPRRLEISLHSFDGRLFISGLPIQQRERAWLLNLRADPRLTIHLKQLLQADLPATAREITADAERRAVLEKIARVWHRDVEPMVAYSPLIEVTIEGFEPAGE